MILTTTEGQHNLPRYFTQVFGIAAGVGKGWLDFVLPDGRRFRAEGPKPGQVAELVIHNPDLFSRLIREGDLGFCEAYVDGWWSTPDLQAFLDYLHDGAEVLYDGFPGRAFLRAYERLRFWLRSNTKRQAPRNIAHHYDLGNEFYALWLDETMTYSSRSSTGGSRAWRPRRGASTRASWTRWARSPAIHVLEIGCGWGGFAEYAAKERGLRVTGLTLSREQLTFAEERMRRQGLEDA
jgi:cyclopropane-fatty-acyl-phospholipid synthase